MNGARWTLPAGEPSVARARGILRWFLAHSSDAPDVDESAALLAVSELVTNAVRHSRDEAPLVLRVELEEGKLHIEVEDSDPHPPRLDVPDQESEHGRGLLIVDRIASDWGWKTREHDTKQVWCDVPPRPQDAPDA